jgi:ribonuclease T2
MLSALAALFAASALAGPLEHPAYRSIFNVDAAATCPTTSQQSCHNTTVQTNLCCFNAPGGALLQTQFWDTDPVTGPDDSWTIHGLWVRSSRGPRNRKVNSWS